jgi:hypothetical protein
MANKMKFWRKSNAKATANGFSRNNPDHRVAYTTKRQVRNGASRSSEEKMPSTLLVSLLIRARILAAA